MNKIHGSFTFAAITMFAMAAWAQDESESEERADTAAGEAEEVQIDANAPPSTEPGCFSARRVRNFSPLSDEALYVDGGGGNHFLLTMFRLCSGLRNAQAIAIDTPVDRVCSNSQASITYRGVGGRRDSCGVRTVESVEDRDAARTIAERRGQQ